MATSVFFVNTLPVEKMWKTAQIPVEKSVENRFPLSQNATPAYRLRCRKMRHPYQNKKNNSRVAKN